MEGLYYYGARWYDPYLNRWCQPDQIIPDQYNPADWDRYSYARNNPLSFSDPSGHIPLLITAAIGAFIGFTANYAIQTYSNMQSGMGLSEAASWSSINKQELVVATVGGFVGGLTLGVSTAVIGAAGLTGGLTTATTAVVGGAASNLAAGQAEALTNATVDQLESNTAFGVTSDGKYTVTFSPNLNQFSTDATNYGFGNQDTMVHDAVVGGVVGGFSAGFQGIIKDIGTPAAEFIGRQPASWIRPASQFFDWLADTFLEYEKKNNPY